MPKPLNSNSKAEGRFGKPDFIYIASDDEYRCPAGQRLIKRFTTVEAGMTLDIYWSSACPRCPIKAQCTTGSERRVRRWVHEAVIDAMQERLDRDPEKMRVRRQTVEHPFGTIKFWMGATHFLIKTLARVRTEMSLHVLAYNFKRVMQLLGINGMNASDERLSRAGSRVARNTAVLGLITPPKLRSRLSGVTGTAQRVRASSPGSGTPSLPNSGAPQTVLTRPRPNCDMSQVDRSQHLNFLEAGGGRVPQH